MQVCVLLYASLRSMHRLMTTSDKCVTGPTPIISTGEHCCKHTHQHTHTCTFSRICTYTHMYAYVHLHTHTHTQALGVRHGVGRPTSDGLVSIDIALRPGPDRFLALQVCVCVCRCVCVYVCLYVYKYVRVHECVCVQLYVCLYTSVCV